MVNVKELRINKNKNELTVTFDDGSSNTLSSELLRVESPSAEVQGHGLNQKKTPSQKSLFCESSMIAPCETIITLKDIDSLS